MKLSKEFIAMFRNEAKKAQWEINRWNGKSIDDLVVDYLERKEIKPEDFKGVVVLTVDEAKDLQNTLLTLCEIAYIDEKSLFDFKKLVKRIEQAEGKL